MLQQAAILAASSKDKKNFFLGSIAVRKDGLLVQATNLTSPENKTPTAHAEVRALKKAGWGATLWVARVTKEGVWALARPCPTCQAFIENKGVKKVYYTIGPNEWGIWRPGNKKVSDYDDQKRKICKNTPRKNLRPGG